jgi:drug/metabolite transporter (DMT)-like permease
MNKLRLSGIVLITGFIVVALGGFIFTPPNLYQERDIEVRMQIVEDYRSQFAFAQIASVVGAAGMAVGYLLLTLHLQGDKTAGLANLGAAAMFLGTTSLAILLLQGISDPRAYLDRASVGGTALSIYCFLRRST